MADIREPFELCKIWNSKSLCGIERETKEDNVIITLLDRGILVYNLEHKKIINHWSVEQKDDVTCAAIQNPATREFVVAVNVTEILTWKENDSDLKNCQRVQSFQPIFGFHVWNSQPFGTLVVFEDGSSSFLDDLRVLSEQEGSKVKRKRISKNSDELLWSGVFVHHCHCYVAAIIERDEDEMYTVVISSFDSKDRSSERKTVEAELIPPAEDAKLLTCCMHEEGQSITSYWSNGTLCSIELENILGLNTSATPISQLSCKYIHRLQLFHRRKPKRSVALKAIDASHVCLSGTCSIDGETKDVITIWNTKFGTLQSWETLDKLMEKSSSPDQLYSLGAGHICCTQSFLCIGFHKFVAACQYSITKCSLASSLGQLDSTARFLADEAGKPELLVTPKLVVLHKAPHKWPNIVNKQNALERKVLKRLTDPTQTPTLETFSSELTNYMELRRSEQGDNTRTSIKWRKRTSETADVFSQHFIASVLSRCVKEKSFWPGESISRLLKTKCVPSSSSRELLDCLVDRGELELIMECFENIKGIPEDVVVHCLRHVLSVEGDSTTKAEGSENMEDAPRKRGGIHEMPVGQTTAKSICTILRYPVNDVFLQDSLRKLSFRESLILMRFLVYIMDREMLSFDKHDWTTDLKYSQVLDWAGLLLNAHCTQLVLMPEAHEVLVSCHRTIRDQVRWFEKLHALEGFLDHYKNRVPLPSVAKTGLYAVEMVEI